MQQRIIRLYQPDEQLVERIPEGVDSLANFIQTLSAQLNQPEFESPPKEDRAVIIAISPTGESVGWAVDRTGKVLDAAQQYLHNALETLTPPPVVHGAIVFAIHYAEAVSGDDWIPLPQAWNDVASEAGRELPIDELVMQYFTETL